MMNILTDHFDPKTFGEFVDALIITNIRMWHAQETIYEPDIWKRLSRENLIDFLKKSTWLNLQRNFQMDGLDGSVVEKIVEQHPNIERRDRPISMEGLLPIWDEV